MFLISVESGADVAGMLWVLDAEVELGWEGEQSRALLHPMCPGRIISCLVSIP